MNYKQQLEKWLEGANTAKFLASFLLFMRFAKTLDSKCLTKLEPAVIDDLGGIEIFRDVLS